MRGSLFIQIREKYILSIYTELDPRWQENFLSKNIGTLRVTRKNNGHTAGNYIHLKGVMFCLCFTWQ
jgi:hypothetical protein